MRAKRPFLETLFFTHRDFTYPPSPEWFWAEIFNLSFGNLKQRKDEGILIRNDLYEEIFNNPDIEKELAKLTNHRMDMVSKQRHSPFTESAS